MMTKLMMAAVCLSVGAAAQAGDAVTFSSFAPAGGAETGNAGSVMNHRAAVVSGPSSRFSTNRSIASVTPTQTTQVQEEVKITQVGTKVEEPVIEMAVLTTKGNKGTLNIDETPVLKTQNKKLDEESYVERDLGRVSTSGERVILKAYK